MKAKFKSEEARQEFIDYGEKHWATGIGGNSNNNRRIARVIGMHEVEVKKCLSPFNDWLDIYIDDEQFESISAEELRFFDITQ